MIPFKNHKSQTTVRLDLSHPLIENRDNTIIENRVEELHEIETTETETTEIGKVETETEMSWIEKAVIIKVFCLLR
jgi:hypothetical protein